MKNEKLVVNIDKHQYVKEIKHIAFKPQYIPINLYPRTHPLQHTNDTVKNEK